MKTLLIIFILSVVSCKKEYAEKQNKYVPFLGDQYKSTEGWGPSLICCSCDSGDLILRSTGGCTTGKIFFGTFMGSDTTYFIDDSTNRLGFRY